MTSFQELDFNELKKLDEQYSHCNKTRIRCNTGSGQLNSLNNFEILLNVYGKAVLEASECFRSIKCPQ